MDEKAETHMHWGRLGLYWLIRVEWVGGGNLDGWLDVGWLVEQGRPSAICPREMMSRLGADNEVLHLPGSTYSDFAFVFTLVIFPSQRIILNRLARTR
jgi:hypothetical protein